MLSPSVVVGKAGLTGAVWKALDRALEDRELIKLRFHGEKDRSIQKSLLSEIAATLDAALVGRIGHVAVLYRPRKDPERRQFEEELRRLQPNQAAVAMPFHPTGHSVASDSLGQPRSAPKR